MTFKVTQITGIDTFRSAKQDFPILVIATASESRTGR